MKRIRDWKKILSYICAVIFVISTMSGCQISEIEEKSISTESDLPAELSQDTKEVEGNLTVTFLDVGQGNATLVESDGEYMLIDGGDRDYSSFVVSYLKELGISELEYVISSHYDADHLNGIVGVLHAFSCENVLAADYVTDTRVYESFREVVAEKEIELIYPTVGEYYELGEVSFAIVSPDSYEYADVNDNSIGIRLVHGENSFLICGDAGIASEMAMLDAGIILDSDVYLASHHGSDGSSSWKFIQEVSPEAVVFSVGKDNSYGHPADRVLEDVKAVGAEIYRTDLQGTITVTSDGQNLAWNTDALTERQLEENSTDCTGNNSEQQTYILNMNTKKFHLPFCSSVEDISVNNKAEFIGNREELLDAGYEGCKRCNP